MSKYFIGLDIGATYVRAMISDEFMNECSDIVTEKFVKKEDVAMEIEENLVKIIEFTRDKIKKKGMELAGIGVAMAALFERSAGVITHWPNNKKWNNFKIRDYLEKRFHVPVILEDDANAAALGEQVIRKGEQFKDLAYVTISTGIGAGIIFNNKILLGSRGWAGELGHIKVSENNELCSCGERGCLQAVASGPAIVKRFQEKSQVVSSVYKREYDIKEIVDLAQNGIKEAEEVFEYAGKHLGIALANMAVLLDVPIVILGGGVIQAGDIIKLPIEKEFKKAMQGKRCSRIVFSTAYNINGVIGALKLICQYEKQGREI